jgi:glutathione synthase/RimK-type ligase-like ATP-grasp enzyme
MNKILILSSSQLDKSKHDALLDLFSNQKKVKVVINKYSDICIDIRDNKIKISDSKGDDIKDYSFVYFFTRGRYSFIAFAIAQYLKLHNIQFIDSEVGDIHMVSKLNEFILLSNKNIPVIDTFYASQEYILLNFENNPIFSYPFIMKDILGRKGRNNYLIKNYIELKQILEINPKIDFVIQPYIENDCDYRILTFDFKARLIIKRSRKNNLTHLNNISNGAVAEIIPIKTFNKEIVSIAEKASKVLKRNLAGVDILIVNKDNYYILEVNNSPQIITGSFIKEKKEILRKYLLSK